MSRSGFDRRLLLFFLLLGLFSLCVPSARAEDCPLYRLPTHRFGVDVSSSYGNITDYDVAALHLGWYSDWSSNLTPLRPGGIEYVQDIWVDAYSGVVSWSVGKGSSGGTNSFEVLGNHVDANLGSLWIIGNEPECPNAPGGGRMTWQQYGDIYHDLYTFIKGRDPTAQIAIGGVVQPTALRRQWLGNLLDYYKTTYGTPMPIDVWNTHICILREQAGSWGAGIPVGLTATEGLLIEPEDNYNIEIFKQLVRDFRTWLNNLDPSQRNKPLIISEFGVLMPESWGATPAVVNAFMTASFDFLLTTTDATTGYPADSNHLVQRWLWSSLNDSPANFNGALFDYLDGTFPGTLTAHGVNFSNYTNSLLAGLSGTVCINGTVQLEARSNHATTTALTLLPVGCPQPDIRRVTTNASGGFSLCNVLPGTYDIVIKGYNGLANRRNAQVLASGSSVNLGVLVPGDANNDNQVALADFAILSVAYRTAEGDPAYDARADFNGDAKVDILDFSLLATHYAQVGAQAW